MRLDNLPSMQNNPSPLESMAGGDGLWGKWRSVQAWEITFETPIAAALVMYSLMTGNKFVIDGLVALTPIITFYLTARYAVVGVHVWRGSQERQMAMQCTQNLNDPPRSGELPLNNRQD
jgi:hypothetical protein